VLYDKQYRPDIYKLKLGHIQGAYDKLKMPYYTNASKEVQDQNFSPSDFEEMQFVEQIASNRAALL
jgi:hypothetical protein